MNSILLIALCLSQSADPAPPDGKLKIFILAGQSNMEGKGDIGVMEYQLTQERTKARFDHLRKNGKWIVRDDVNHMHGHDSMRFCLTQTAGDLSSAGSQRQLRRCS